MQLLSIGVAGTTLWDSVDAGVAMPGKRMCREAEMERSVRR